MKPQMELVFNALGPKSKKEISMYYCVFPAEAGIHFQSSDLFRDTSFGRAFVYTTQPMLVKVT
jgi:hypothetical protein